MHQYKFSLCSHSHVDTVNVMIIFSELSVEWVPPGKLNF